MWSGEGSGGVMEAGLVKVVKLSRWRQTKFDKRCRVYLSVVLSSCGQTAVSALKLLIQPIDHRIPLFSLMKENK